MRLHDCLGRLGQGRPRVRPNNRPTRTDKPVKGDIGVVEVPTDGKLQLAGAIFTGKSWAIKAPQGATTMIPYSVAAAWSVGYVQN